MKCHIHLILIIDVQKSSFEQREDKRMKSLRLLLLTRKVGLYSSWDSIVSKSIFDWVVLDFERGEVLFKSGVAFKRIRYVMHMYLSIGNNEHPMHLFLLASLLNGSSLYFVIGRHSSNFLHIS